MLQSLPLFLAVFPNGTRHGKFDTRVNLGAPGYDLRFSTKGGKSISDRHPQDRGQRINEQIRMSPVRLIGAQGEQLGVVPTSQAIEMAREGLQLEV